MTLLKTLKEIFKRRQSQTKRNIIEFDMLKEHKSINCNYFWVHRLWNFRQEDNATTAHDASIKFDIRNYSSADQAFLGFMLAGKENINTLPFELIVLETAFSSVISRLRRHQVRNGFVWFDQQYKEKRSLNNIRPYYC